MEINWGLGRDTNPSSNIKSYITYVSQLPSGQESGQYLALDLGGTNFRVLLVSILYYSLLYCTALYCAGQPGPGLHQREGGRQQAPSQGHTLMLTLYS